jgi:hypothetical protein
VTFRGKVQDGRIKIKPIGSAGKTALPRGKKKPVRRGLLALLDLTINDRALPTDVAQQHDHYIYGTPKRVRPARDTRHTPTHKGSSRPRKTRLQP